VNLKYSAINLKKKKSKIKIIQKLHKNYARYWEGVNAGVLDEQQNCVNNALEGLGDIFN
jgi:RPA family protein